MKKKTDVIKRIEGILATICLLIFFVTGCGKASAIDTTTIAIEKDGSIIQTVIEEFPMDYYDVDELKSMNQSEVDEYNQNVSKEAVKIKNTESDGNTVKVVMEYKNADAYYDLNGSPIYFGTVEQAQKAGYDLNVTLNSMKDDSSITKNELMEMGDRHIVILNENVNLKTFGTILYASEGVTCESNKKLATVSGDEKSYIVFK